MKNITLYLVVILITSGPIFAENRVWTTCEEDSDCGPNEICQKSADLDLPCSKGLCACRPCYDIYSWSDTCTRPIYKALNDECETQEQEGVLYPPNARCSTSGIVECIEGYQDSLSPHFEKSCEKIGAIYELPEDEQACERNAECYGDLVCNNQFKCSCYFGHEKWDRRNKRCVKREYGDTCQSDDDCNVSGHNWQGYTYSSGACVDGTCACSDDGKRLVVSYFEPGTAILKAKPICVANEANASLKRGSPCTLDPIYNGDSSKAQICPTSMVCYQCPEQYERHESPICRSVFPPQATTQNCYPPRRTTTTTTTTKEAITSNRLQSWGTNNQIISLSGLDYYSEQPVTSPSYKMVDLAGGENDDVGKFQEGASAINGKARTTTSIAELRKNNYVIRNNSNGSTSHLIKSPPPIILLLLFFSADFLLHLFITSSSVMCVTFE